MWTNTDRFLKCATQHSRVALINLIFAVCVVSCVPLFLSSSMVKICMFNIVPCFINRTENDKFPRHFKIEIELRLNRGQSLYFPYLSPSLILKHSSVQCILMNKCGHHSNYHSFSKIKFNHRNFEKEISIMPTKR